MHFKDVVRHQDTWRAFKTEIIIECTAREGFVENIRMARKTRAVSSFPNACSHGNLVDYVTMFDRIIREGFFYYFKH